MDLLVDTLWGTFHSSKAPALYAWIIQWVLQLNIINGHPFDLETNLVLGKMTLIKNSEVGG